MNDYLALVYRAALVDATIATAFMRVINLLETPHAYPISSATKAVS